MNIIKTLLASAVVAAAFAPAAFANDHTDVVRDKHGQPVTTKAGDCVRTKWEGGDSQCASGLGLEARTVYFGFDSAELDGAAKAKLDALSGTIRRSTGVVGAKVVGYADPIGDAKYNMMLSKQRAENVAYYLASKGVINTSVADVKALGEGNTRANCPKKMKRKERIACLAPDRRVEVELVYAN